MQDWKEQSRRAVDEAAARASYRCPRGKEWKGELSDESKDALRQARGSLGIRTIKTRGESDAER